jgi:multicomponent Na+:H+ antiporter subunit F
MMNVIIIALIVALFIPLLESWRNDDIWQKMLALASFSSKTAIIFLCIAVSRNDWMMGVTGVIILSVGNAGYMLLAHLLKRLNS